MGAFCEEKGRRAPAMIWVTLFFMTAIPPVIMAIFRKWIRFPMIMRMRGMDK